MACRASNEEDNISCSSIWSMLSSTLYSVGLGLISRFSGRLMAFSSIKLNRKCFMKVLVWNSGQHTSSHWRPSYICRYLWRWRSEPSRTWWCSRWWWLWLSLQRTAFLLAYLKGQKVRLILLNVANTYTHSSFSSSISSPKMAWIKMTNIYNLWFFMIIPQVNDK